MKNTKEQDLYFLDTNICSYIINGRSDYKYLESKLLEYSPSIIKIPSIVASELYYGVIKGFKNKSYSKDIYNKKKEHINMFLAPYQIIGFGRNSAIIYAKLRNKLEWKGMVMSDFDCMIASIVLVNNGVLITNDNHFNRINKLNIENWLK